MADYELKDVISECKKSAKIGYNIASSQHKALKETLSNAKSDIKKTLIDFQTSKCYVSGATDMLSEQLSAIESDLDSVSLAFTEDLQNLHENLASFSISLFGRTMTGKSTLMEILTQGNGQSIGKGAQRTTRDVRKYTWNGLEITDVPGIGAFEGEDDEGIAFEAAKKADLILFLITDDAPQAKEAECFGRIVNLGKPVICIMNVKSAISDTKIGKLAIRDINNRFGDMSRLEDIKNEFLSYSKKLGQEWGYVPFVYVHLKSAYIAQTLNDPNLSDSLTQASRIDNLKRIIVNQVRNKGKFFRIKTFVDIISNPIISSMESLLSQSLLNSSQGRTILAKKRQLKEWRDQFERDGKNRIGSLIINIQNQLNSEVASFAEDHFDDSKADKAWDEVIQNLRIASQCQELLIELEEQCNNKIKEVSREIENELKFTSEFTADSTLRMSSIFDGKKFMSWSTVVVSGGLGVAAIIASIVGSTLAGPLGWIAAGVGIIGGLISLFFSSREKKEQEARSKLEGKLRENVNKICSSLKKRLIDNFDILINKRIDALTKEIDRMNSVIFRLADTQKELAWNLNKHLMELNYSIVKEGINHIQAEGLEYSIIEVARIPGIALTIMLRDSCVFPKEQLIKLKSLLSESIRFIYDTDNKRILISRVVGKSIDRNKITIEEKIGVAHIHITDPPPYLINRIRLAQQMARIAITK